MLASGQGWHLLVCTVLFVLSCHGSSVLAFARMAKACLASGHVIYSALINSTNKPFSK